MIPNVPAPTPISDGRISVGRQQPWLVLAGLCVLEPPEDTLRQARALKESLAGLPITFVFKASFDKANRSSIKGFRGPGMKDGLALLAEVKRTLDVPIVTDVHETEQCAAVAEVADILQIPAFLCRQTDLIIEAARTGRIVNVKKGQFLAPWDVKPIIAKVRDSGNPNVMITERGTSFGYNTLVNDFRGLPKMRALDVPVIFDATHSVQQPGAHGDRTGGDRTMVPHLARAAAAVGVDGFFFEVHEDPSRAQSDADNALVLTDLRPLLEQLLRIAAAV
jgi:2-dehydro-3-deoxyphosphooctonate aldolase (KDO 8-P synthase)